MIGLMIGVAVTLGTRVWPALETYALRNGTKALPKAPAAVVAHTNATYAMKLTSADAFWPNDPCTKCTPDELAMIASMVWP